MDTGSQIVIYKSNDVDASIEVQIQGETVWLNRNQLAELFDRDVKTIGKHINNVFKEAELDKGATVAKYAIVQKEGSREVNREVEHYNLDVIISVGYRVKSKQGTQFRIWANINYNKKLVNVDELTKSILQKAFAGELTSTSSIPTNKTVVV